MQFYLQLWENVPSSPSQKLIVQLLRTPGILDAAAPPKCPSPLMIEHWSGLLPTFLRYLSKNPNHIPRQLILPTGTWTSLKSPDALFVALTASIDNQPSDLLAAFDVTLNTDDFIHTRFRKQVNYEGRQPFGHSHVNGTGALGNIAPAGYARFLDPIRHAGTFIFVDTFCGASVFLTWPRNEHNFHYVKGLLQGSDGSLESSRSHKSSRSRDSDKPDKSTKPQELDEPDLHSLRLGLSIDDIGGMLDGTLMTDCQPYYVNGESSFCLPPNLYVAVVPLETILFVTVPLYSARSKAAFAALKNTVRLALRMKGHRRAEVKESLHGAWSGLEDSTENAEPEGYREELNLFCRLVDNKL